MNELELLKQQKLNELMQKQAEEQRHEQEIASQISQLENIVKPYMTKEAAERYGTVRMAHPEQAVQSLILVAEWLNKRKEKITDERYKEVLMHIMPKKREIKITRK